MRDSPGTWGSGGCLPTPPSSPVESQGDRPSLHFWWKIRRVRSPLPTPSSMAMTGGERTKDKQETKPFPTKMTTHGSSGSLWHLLLMAGWLRPEDPAITRRPGLVPAPSTNRWAEWTGWATQPGHLSPDPCCQPPAPASGTSGCPHRQCLPKTGGWRWTDGPHGGQKRCVGAAQRWPCWGRTCHTGTSGSLGGSRVQPPSGPCGPSLLADLIWKDTSLYAICPHPTPA